MQDAANHHLLGLLPLIPLLGSGLVYFLTNRSEKTHRFAGWLATFFSFVSFLAGLSLYSTLNAGASVLSYKAWTWFSLGDFTADFAFSLDNLSAVMTLIITGVGTLIHLYAIGYMQDDKNRPRFFCYLNLFLFAMLLLVLGDNLLVMFVGWEGVGLCSYLLIGFWFKEMDNAKAGQKAFVVNRIGDAGFLLGIFTLFLATGTINFTELGTATAGVSSGVLELVAILLFIGAVGKSAQIPLYIWLPDAMAGPTPVSALIHAATMVTAGVYMITRLSFVYLAAPHALLIISIIGTLTALLAASIALVQNDIKKVLAYSTVSQLGYMFMAIGAGAFSNGIYHVVTHAFFKACLFMGAGSVIIGCHHEQDMREFGGLRKKMPLTFLTYFVATIAIAGIPPLSGFFSKDAILWTVFSSQGLTSEIEYFGYPLAKILWALGALTALMTAFYMTRSLVLTFFGEYRGHTKPHESPWVVTLPLLVLAAFSAVFAFIWGESLMTYLAQWTRLDMRVSHDVLAQNHTYHMLEITSIIIAAVGVAAAFVIYLWMPRVVEVLAKTFPRIYRAMCDKWLVDELYQALVVKPLLAFSWFLFKVIDRSLIDATVDGAGIFVNANGEIARRLHTGKVGTYALLMFLGTLFLLIFWLLF